MKIMFFGRESGQILKEKLTGAGFHIVAPESREVDLIVVGFYGKILPKKILEIPRYGALNVHPSLLPKYRGPTPVQATILNGETKTGVSIILMDEEADHGPIIATESFEIGDKRFTTPELTKELWELGGNLLIQTIPQWIAGTITPIPQNHSKATYTKLLKKEDGKIDWSKPALYIERQARAYFPWPGTFTTLKVKSQNVNLKSTTQNSKLLKILEAAVLKKEIKDKPGTIFATADGKLAVQTGKDALIIETLQLEGGKFMPSKEFLLGHKDILNQSFR